MENGICMLNQWHTILQMQVQSKLQTNSPYSVIIIGWYGRFLVQ